MGGDELDLQVWSLKTEDCLINQRPAADLLIDGRIIPIAETQKMSGSNTGWFSILPVDLMVCLKCNFYSGAE